MKKQVISEKGQALTIVKTQAVVSLLLAFFFYLFAGRQAAFSAVLGAWVCVLPNALFIWKFFSYSGAQAAKKIVHSFYVGEGLKLLTTILLFALVIIYVPINALIFFISYVVIQMVMWTAPLFSRSR